jgi:peptidoglycan/LPS O-acetylase OafA/YrhL
MNQVYLKGLNGLRAIAALVVVYSHTCTRLDLYNLENNSGSLLADYGVSIFFALSGFLITYLLLLEKQQSGTIGVKNFYLRRLLRIWPLYFLYLFLNIVFFGDKILNERIFYYLLFVPNIAFTLNQNLPNLYHFWSIGVEEQFYLFWPLLTLAFKNVLRSVVLFIILFFGFKLLTNIYLGGDSILYVFLSHTRFECMAIGGLGAVCYFFNKKAIHFLQNKVFQLVSWAIVALSAFNLFYIFTIIDHVVISIVTVIIILNQISNEKKLVSLENKVFNYIGGISFGIYIYHPLVINSLPFILEHIYAPTWVKVLYVHSSVLLVTIIISHISYNYLEKPILKHKSKFSVIQSTNRKQYA